MRPSHCPSLPWKKSWNALSNLELCNTVGLCMWRAASDRFRATELQFRAGALTYKRARARVIFLSLFYLVIAYIQASGGIFVQS